MANILKSQTSQNKKLSDDIHKPSSIKDKVLMN